MLQCCGQQLSLSIKAPKLSSIETMRQKASREQETYIR
jgi:hypothetical protein